jgi:ankyrin repeat protein
MPCEEKMDPGDQLVVSHLLVSQSSDKVRPTEGSEAMLSICRSGNVEQLQAYLEQAEGADVNATLDSQGNTGLHLAASFGHLRMVQELLQRSASVDAREGQQRTPLHTACKNGYPEVCLELLVGRADASLTDASSENAAHKAVFSGDVAVLKIVHQNGQVDLAMGDAEGNTPLMQAAAAGHVDIVRYILLCDGVLSQAMNGENWTALAHAANGFDFKVSSLRPPRYANSVKMLLDAKAEVDTIDLEKKTPLHKAATIGNLLSAGNLIAGGANLEAGDGCRWRPLHHACHAGHEKMVEFLLTKKANADIANPGCVTPLALAVAENMPKMAELLLKHKADPNARGHAGLSPMMLARKNKDECSEILSMFEVGVF